MSGAAGEIMDGMRIERDLPIAMDDGLVLRADLFRPVAAGRYPAPALEIMAGDRPEEGWLRASHRKLDPGPSPACRPYRSHDEPPPLLPIIPAA